MTGVIREIRSNVDPLKSFRVTNSTLAVAFLGPLGTGDWGKVTIHSPSPNKDVAHSYTAWIRTGELATPELSREIPVHVALSETYIAGVSKNIWVCNEIEIL